MHPLINFSNRGRFLCSLLMPFLAAGLEKAFWDDIDPFIFLLFYPAVFGSAWLGGLVGGMLATLFSVVLIIWYFIEPTHTFSIAKSIHVFALGVFTMVGGLFAWSQHIFQRNLANLQQTQQQLQQLLTDEQTASARFKIMFEASPFGIALVDSDTGYLYEVNQAFADIVGRPRAQLGDIDWMQITHPDDVQADLDNMRRLNAGEIDWFQMNKRYLRPDQSIVWVSLKVTPFTVELTHRTHLCWVEDVTRRLESEKQIAEAQALAAKFQSEQRYRTDLAQISQTPG